MIPSATLTVTRIRTSVPRHLLTASWTLGWPSGSLMTPAFLIDPRPSTNQSTSLKNGSLYLLMVSVRTRTYAYVHKKLINKEKI